MWYTINQDSNHYVITELSGTIDQTVWNGIDTEDVKITFFVEDELGNIGQNHVIIQKNQPNPTSKIPGFDIILLTSLIFLGISYLFLQIRMRSVYLFNRTNPLFHF